GSRGGVGASSKARSARPCGSPPTRLAAGPFPPRFAPGDKAPGDKGAELCPPRSGGRSLPPELAEAGGRGQSVGDGFARPCGPPPTRLAAGPFPPRFAPGYKAPGYKAPGVKAPGVKAPRVI